MIPDSDYKTFWGQEFNQFLEAILHGSEEHREWLTEAVQAFWDTKQIPEVRG